MRLNEIEKKARKLNIKDSWKYSKRDLIKEIQRREGNFPCFATTQGSCNQVICCWREDCLK